jgi:hypothetical protein
MLIYHPAFDAYHCVFRFIRLLERLNSCEVQRARILDFLVVFPSCLADIRLPREAAHIRTTAKQLANPYHDPVNSKQVFREMEHIQIAAMRCLAGAGVVDAGKFRSGTLERTKTPISGELIQHSEPLPIPNETLSNFLFVDLTAMPLTGPDGLKHRTGLLEHRYDAT